MSNYKCNKCGETASSKCARSRNVFPDNKTATLINNMLSVEINPAEGYSDNVVEVRFNLLVVPDDKTDRTAVILQALTNLKYLDEDNVAIATCKHEWELQADTCQLGCCTRHVNVEEEDTGAADEAEYYAELNRGYAQDRI